MSFQLVLDTTSLPNVLVDIIHSYQNFRPVAYQFCCSYLKERLGERAFKYVKVHKIVGEMVSDFERLVEHIVHKLQTMAWKDVTKYFDQNEVIEDLEGKMFPIVEHLVSRFVPQSQTSYDHWSENDLSRKDTRNIVLPSLISFAEGNPWVSTVKDEQKEDLNQ